MTRRSFWPAAAVPALLGQAPPARQGRLKQSVTRGCFGRGVPFEEMCAQAARLGLKAFDLIGPRDFPTLRKYGLLPTMVPGGSSIRDGINHAENHAHIEPLHRAAIEAAAAAGAPNVIILSGERHGISDEQGLENTVTFLNRVKAQAEDRGVTICLELLNSKVNHPDYQCDHTRWGAEVCRRVNSPRVKLLYDIYHMQIMEGDVIRTIRENIQYIGHFHTAGVPGRHELGGPQELNYRAIAAAIVETGYSGYLAHEYGPTGDPLKALEEALEICDV